MLNSFQDNASEMFLASGTGADVAVIDAAGHHRHDDLRRAVATQIATLVALDLPPGSRVGLLGANSAGWVASYLAVMAAGHTVVPLAPVLTPADVRAKLAHVGAVAAVVDERVRRRFADALADLDHVLGHATPTGVDLGMEFRPPASEAVLMFTSGTTSSPRAVRVGHDNLLANTAAIIEYLGLRRDDRMLVVLPFSYCFGASLLHTHLAVGGSVRVCETQAYPETVVDAIDADRCTGFAGVPSSYQLLLRGSSFASRELPSLRHLQQAGGRLPAPQVERVVAAQPHARLFVMYGQTEATARLAYLPPERLHDKLGAVGLPVRGVRLRVTDEDGADVAQGEVGEIRASGASITHGYWADPAATAEKFVGGELRTGDLGRVDDEGFLTVVDRSADFIKSWGYRVSSHELEDAALAHEAVTASAVVGRPDPDAGEAIVMFACLRPGSEVGTDELAAHLRARLARHLVPQEIRLLDELPLNDNGKVLKAELRRLATADPPAHAAERVGARRA